MTTGDVAAWCGVHFRTVLRWIERGHLKAFKLPSSRGDHRIRVEDFLDFLKKNDIPIPPQLTPQSNRILLVEDDPAAAKLFQKALEKYPFEVAVAQNGVQAGALLTTFRPNLIAVDLNVPGLGGLEIIKSVRQIANYKDMKILVISGMGEDALREACQAGADAALAKPYQIAKLIDLIQEMAPKNGEQVEQP